ncbi:L-ribulose-5-phosphate 3-epimerase [Lentisphaerota bacterium ZTH]|nr:L-ribulose-5-phosphate 3-epimerase [Lentisphaerota bacterium]WET05354.1 L-ribulose-5-phosphate 3-epimerase [Lentisphaerota bacterium ZTH]
MSSTPFIGIYEKALPATDSWFEKLALAKFSGYNFVEISIDESNERLSRLEWSSTTRKKVHTAAVNTGVSIPTMCLSGHRRYPFGSADADTRRAAGNIMCKAIDLAVDLGIRNIQLAGYDVYYEESTPASREYFIEGLQNALDLAAQAQVMLSIEIMDHPFINSITRYNEITAAIDSPWLTLYPDVGNLSAWNNDIEKELKAGINKITAIHLKDTLAVTDTFPGKFKEVPFGEGCVDFPKVFRTLKSLNYKGPFLIEMWTEKAEDPIEKIISAKRWILKQMRKGGFISC